MNELDLILYQSIALETLYIKGSQGLPVSR